MLSERQGRAVDPGAESTSLLQLCAEDFTRACHRLEWPTPRVELGQSLRGIASAAADISDGLLGDLGHILERSGVGATLDTNMAFGLLGAHRYSAQAATLLGAPEWRSTVLQHVLSGGDDYELVFTAAASQRNAVQAAALACNTPVTRIGQIDSAPGLRLLGPQGQPLVQRFRSFDHFAGSA
jgi:thiamine-monophosphate kinase